MPKIIELSDEELELRLKLRVVETRGGFIAKFKGIKCLGEGQVPGDAIVDLVSQISEGKKSFYSIFEEHHKQGGR